MQPIYLDHQSTTPVDPEVLERMLPFFTTRFGNAGSITHRFGHDAREAVDEARNSIAQSLNCDAREIVFTSGATESNNLALRGMYQRLQRRGRHIVSVVTEHRAILDPLHRLRREGADVTLLEVHPQGHRRAGAIDPQQLESVLRDDTILVSVMWANNEIGTLQPIPQLAEICRRRNIVFHSDATQAVGKIPIDLAAAEHCDLLSFSAHKMYGPKGVGALFVRRRRPALRPLALLEGGGQEFGLRSGTLNVPGIVGLATALSVSIQRLPDEALQRRTLRDALAKGLLAAVPGSQVNGPPLDEPEARLDLNLNLSFPGLDGQALMLQVPEIAVSSGSACTAADPHPSHVLEALGLTPDAIRSSWRLAVGRWTTAQQIQQTVELVAAAASRLRALSG